MEVKRSKLIDDYVDRSLFSLRQSLLIIKNNVINIDFKKIKSNIKNDLEYF